MTASRTARERARTELTREIVEAARRRLATEGAAGLSLRAVARDLGMVSSAIYRYFPSRDELLTVLIVDGYNALGTAAETSESDETDYAGRWLALGHAVRDWAVAHPQEYALLHGSPVPGYRAPQDTVVPAMRAIQVYGRLVSEAHRAGAAGTPVGFPDPLGLLAADAERVRQVMPGTPDGLVLRAVGVWTALFGWIGFELSGQFEGTLLERRAAFDHHLHCQATLLGLPAGAT
ncbi:TetR/AcrR family transcriptional regulator [Solihabitans fulvus]|uniref:TetR/AcrR family transcriptional regulator n=1 Tax=Solihabitans fulvus TaxID=1892852 RepID=A0A5B2XR51_9PSEU|nr:TetR/AcrR family transcriptional regulator [Solihabitans fulvus]KAA2265361.1 TetR/AcrR family transcriptional regulator [Solihabitans fulvus]